METIVWRHKVQNGGAMKIEKENIVMMTTVFLNAEMDFVGQL